MRLTIDGVTVDVGAATILNGANIQVERGHFAALVGPNGCGKSTLLRTVYRAWRPTAGTVLVGDEDVWAISARKSARRTAVVAQDHGSDLDLSVREVAALGLIPHQGSLSRDSAADRSLVEQALGRVGLLALAGRAYPTLSGGERQRVHIARALVQQSPLVLLDEPTNHLDIRYQIETMQLIRNLGVTSLAALHDLNLAAEYCDRVHVMQAGRIVAAGPPAEVLTSELIGAVFGVRAERFVSPATGRLRLALSAFAPEGAAAKTPRRREHRSNGSRVVSQTVNVAVHLDRTDEEVRLDEVERYWHQVAPWYDGDLAGRDNAGHTRSPAELRAWKLTFRRILGPPPLRVLDVGTGTGNLALMLASFGYDVTAVDIAAGMLDITRAKAERAGLDITLAQAKAADLHFESATFGAVVSRLVLWTQPEPEHTVRSWCRVTRPGGRVVTIETLHGRRGGLTARARHGLGQAVLRLQGKPAGFLDDRACLDQLPLGNVAHPCAYRNTFLRAGLRDILIEPLIGIHRIQRRSLALPHRLWPADLEYLVEGTVPDCPAVG